MVPVAKVFVLIASKNISMVTVEAAAVNLGAADNAYTVKVYNLSPGPWEHGAWLLHN